MVTTSDCMFPLPSYNVDSPELLSEIQNGLIGLYEIPQGLTRFGSVMAALPGVFETTVVLWYTPPTHLAPAKAVPGNRSSTIVSITATAPRNRFVKAQKKMNDDDRAGQQLGVYLLIRLLGRGMYSEVYFGEHLHLNYPVAIKILSRRFSSNEVKKFLVHASTLAQLQHPHIA